MWGLSLFPFALQAVAMVFDEGYFHLKRGLPRWERIGHPIDTLSVIVCMGWVLFVPFYKATLAIYCILAVLSCLLVTKDEFVHKEHCPALENWLHALLFLLHPITLGVAGFMWPIVQGIEVPSWIAQWMAPREIAHLFLQMQFVAMALFFVYQVIYWNFIWRENDQ